MGIPTPNLDNLPNISCGGKLEFPRRDPRPLLQCGTLSKIAVHTDTTQRAEVGKLPASRRAALNALVSSQMSAP
ncbi:hypothetical protein CC2G_006066 [Coprinopsis cinerea AmutBmut pab1-1]|nr:hypothetical protein CC2G_006066 [Coprinopsis cinerea AmutBmut pab1-1]